ncbi:ABC transporter integral membrane protein [Treponema primitia ZAS-2]|uniref:ABC transporter integral membrane protein n=1 Tax=Treponema primitia (strain ATCC BAA-887 / DSM 12427 / ZAS-2) TaxID=545694 RepID=F5YR36_TREPZ|nr:ABC transporter [Treponema primitia]AEF84541.1 ABC transporter integral membrane protein [Treponema primitia ZAS-2]
MKQNFKLQSFLADNAVVLIFVIITLGAIPISGLPLTSIVQEILTRIGRNCFLVFSLLLPIMAGMGINFGMVLGAMAGQIGLIFVVDWNIVGVTGLLFASLIAIPIAAILGWIAGQILNRARGREMVTGYVLGFFMDGFYQFIVLYLMGQPSIWTAKVLDRWTALIPIHSPTIILSRGYGIRNTLNLDAVRQSLDKFIPLKIGAISVPVANYIVIGLLCLFIIWFRKTKLGHDMRAVGQNQAVAHAAGIPVDRTRILAIVISTILASLGQIIFLQNMGNIATYNAHQQTGFFAAAAILVGGASVSKASIPNVFIGTMLLHLMYIVVPRAGTNLFGDAQIGEYFRDAFSYAIIALALVIHAWRKRANAEAARSSLRGGTEAVKE